MPVYRSPGPAGRAGGGGRLGARAPLHAPPRTRARRGGSRRVGRSRAPAPRGHSPPHHTARHWGSAPGSHSSLAQRHRWLQGRAVQGPDKQAAWAQSAGARRARGGAGRGFKVVGTRGGLSLPNSAHCCCCPSARLRCRAAQQASAPRSCHLQRWGQRRGMRPGVRRRGRPGVAAVHRASAARPAAALRLLLAPAPLPACPPTCDPVANDCAGGQLARCCCGGGGACRLGGRHLDTQAWAVEGVDSQARHHGRCARHGGGGRGGAGGAAGGQQWGVIRGRRLQLCSGAGGHHTPARLMIPQALSDPTCP